MQRVLEFCGGSIIIRRFNTVQKDVRKCSKRQKKYRDTQREKGNSKIVGNSPWSPKKSPKSFENSIDVC